MVNNFLKNLEKYIKKFNIQNNNKEIFFLTAALCFAILCRILPFILITVISLLLLFFVIVFDFYNYIIKNAKIENKQTKIIEFSWGFVKEKTQFWDLSATFQYLFGKDFNFYKTYFFLNLDKVIMFAFVFGDLIVAFKNLSFFDTGIYIALSIFTKFVFLGYVYLSQIYSKIPPNQEDTQENILDVFYSQMNGLISLFVVLFILFFILSKYLVNIFFGNSYLPYESSLPFVLLGNMALVIAVSIYTTAKKVDPATTEKICKVYLTLFSVLFVFMTVNYIDTITYFVVGSGALLSIFLYNFAIKKPKYISDTYNFLF